MEWRDLTSRQRSEACSVRLIIDQWRDLGIVETRSFDARIPSIYRESGIFDLRSQVLCPVYCANPRECFRTAGKTVELCFPSESLDTVESPLFRRWLAWLMGLIGSFNRQRLH